MDRRTSTISEHPGSLQQAEWSEPSFDFSRFLRELWRGKWLLALFGAVGLLGAHALLSLTVPTYVSSGVLVLEPQPAGVFRPNSVFSSRTIDQAMVDSQVEVLGSALMISQVIERLSLLDDEDLNGRARGWSFSANRSAAAPLNSAIEEFRKHLSVERIGTSNAIRISFWGRDPDKAAMIVNALARIYLANQLAQPSADGSDRIPLIDRILVTQAAPPSTPASPRRSIYYGMGLALGLFGAVAVILGRRPDARIRAPERISELLEVPCLAQIPTIGGLAKRPPFSTAGQLPSGARIFRPNLPENPGSKERGLAWANGWRSVVQTIRETETSRQRNVLGVVALSPGEGASTAAAMIAVLLARQGQRTLLVDCCITVKGLSRGLGKQVPGLGDVLAGSAASADVSWKSDCGLVFVPAGAASHSHPADLLASPAMGRFIEATTAQYDYVILDLPPLTRSVAARAAGPAVDAFLLVSEWGATTEQGLTRMINNSGAVGDKLLAFLINKSKAPLWSR